MYGQMNKSKYLFFFLAKYKFYFVLYSFHLAIRNLLIEV